MEGLLRAAGHARLHRGKRIVVKIGGACLARPAARARVARQVACVEALGAHPLVVHGGGPQTSELQRALGEEPRLVDGRRVTSPTALRALRFAVIGELGGDLAAALAAAGARALATSAAGCGVRARRRPPVMTSEGEVDFGLVGDVVAVDPTALASLLAGGVIPVVGPPAAGEGEELFNVNADLLAAEIAVALGAEKLCLLTDAPGILRDARDAASAFSTLSLAELDALEREGALTGGMRVKAAAIRRALEGGVRRVHVVDGRDEEALLVELYTASGAGTLVTREANEPLAAAEALS